VKPYMCLLGGTELVQGLFKKKIHFCGRESQAAKIALKIRY
jgi:hypothetical protein